MRKFPGILATILLVASMTVNGFAESQPENTTPLNEDGVTVQTGLSGSGELTKEEKTTQQIQIEEADRTDEATADGDLLPTLENEIISALNTNDGNQTIAEDIVTIDGDHAIIVTPEGIVLDITIPTGYVLFTMDLYASADVYSWAGDFYEAMVKNEWHAYLYDKVATGRVYMTVENGNYLSQKIENLNQARADQLISFGKSYAKSKGRTYTDVITTGNNMWVRYDDIYMTTIVGGYYIHAFWNNSDYSEKITDKVDIDEIVKLLSAVNVYSQPASNSTDSTGIE